MLTEKQIEERRGWIGASDAAAILGISPFQSAYDVWAMKTGRVPANPGTPATRAGDRLEEVAILYAEDELGPIERNVVAPHPDIPFIRSQLDGVVVSSGSPVDGKTAGILNPFYVSDVWGEADTEDVPDWYYTQILVQMACKGVDTGYISALIGGRGANLYAIKMNFELAHIALDELVFFWENHVLTDTPPENSLPSEETIKRLRRVPGKVVQIPPGLVTERQRLRKELSALEKQFKEADQRVKAALGDAEGGAGDGFDLTYKMQHRGPVGPSDFRVLRVKGE